MRRALLLALLAASSVLAQDAEGLRIRLDAWFGAADDSTRATALAALESATVPRDLAGRVRAIRRSLPAIARKPASRVTETVAGLECFFATPTGYDAKKSFSGVISLHGKHGNGHHGLQPFALPDEEWAELEAP